MIDFYRHLEDMRGKSSGRKGPFPHVGIISSKDACTDLCSIFALCACTKI